MEVVENLKSKLAEIDGKMEALRREIALLESQKAAFYTVIRCYDPYFTGTAGPVKARRTPARGGATSRTTELFNGRNVRHITLDILRVLEHPATTAEVAEKFSADAGLGDAAASSAPGMTSRFSATLLSLAKQGLVRQISTEGSRRCLWEISR